jgi:hypothetical protein
MGKLIGEHCGRGLSLAQRDHLSIDLVAPVGAGNSSGCVDLRFRAQLIGVI